MNPNIQRVGASLLVLLTTASCSGDDGGDSAQRLVVAVDVAVPEDVGGWTPDAPGSARCTFEARDAFAFTATDVDGRNVLVEPFGDDSIDEMPLGSFSGEIVDGACRNLLVLDVSTTERVQLNAKYRGASIGKMETSAIEQEPSAGLQGRRSAGSPWRLAR